MWRRWVGLIVGALLGYTGGAGAASRLLSPLGAQGGEATDPTWLIAAGLLTSVIGAAAGYQRGRHADMNRRR